MRLIGVAILCIGSAAMMFGQRQPGVTQPYGSLGGYGNVLYPGTGHAPNVNQSFPAQLGATVAGRPPFGSGFARYPVSAPRASHPAGHNRSTVVPYPVYIGGGYYGGYAPDTYAAPPPQEQMPMMDSYGTPSVVINQNFVPDRARPVVREYGDEQAPDSSGMRLYETPPTHPYADQGQQAPVRRQPAPDAQPTIYLLAFKDHNIIPALGYWMEGNTLHYVSVEHSLNQASLDLIDRDLSQRLNDERGVEFKLPKQ
jgi:hypothetical protein